MPDRIKWLGWLLVLLMTACGGADTSDLQSADGGPEVECRTNSDCPTDEVCTADGECSECGQDADCGAGEVCRAGACEPRGCSRPSDCPSGQLCIAGRCESPPSCGPNNPCPGGLVCGDEGTCGPCASDWVCEMGEVCQMGVCSPGQTCTTSRDCPAERRCSRGLCRAPCTANADCGPPMGLFQCDDAAGECRQRCLASMQCPMGQFCSDLLCVPAECQTDADCMNSERCQGANDGRGRCIIVSVCSSNADCPTGQTCNPNTGLCVASTGCRTDRECEAGRYCDPSGFCQFGLDCASRPCPTGFDCVASTCVPAVCRGDADCMAPQRCLGGQCQAPGPSTSVTRVLILTPRGAVRPGGRYAFQALALDQAGQAVPGLSFDWTSSSTAVAAINRAGVAQGGRTSGVSSIRASLQGATGRIDSNPVELTNLGPASVRDTVVRVSERVGGRPVGGALVQITAGRRTEVQTTDAQGLARFGGLSTRPMEVTVASAAHDWVTVLGVTSADFGVGLAPLTRRSEAAGVSGTVDFSLVNTTGALEIGVSGLSIGSPLLGFDAGALFGGEIHQASIPMVGRVPVPENNTLALTFMGSTLPLKTTWYVRGTSGLRATWAFGGRVDFLGSGLGLDDLRNLATALLPFFQRFDHAVAPAQPLVAVPTVPDGTDLDGDGNVNEQRPNWAALPTARLRPSAAQNLRYQIRVATLPVVTGGNANALVAFGGSVLPGAGFVPLGIDGQSDRMGNRIVPSFLTRMAAPHGGLESGRYAVLVTALRIDAAGIAGPGSTRLSISSTLPTTIDFSSGWTSAPLRATWRAAAREIAVATSSRTDAYRLRFDSAEGGWEVFGPATTTIIVPNAPPGFADRATGTVTLDAVDLDGGASPWGELFDAVSGAPASFDGFTTGYARAVISP